VEHHVGLRWLVLSFAVTCAHAENRAPGSRTRSLVEAHLRQAEGLDRTAGARDAPPALAQVRAEIDRQARTWRARVERASPVPPAITRGIPADALARAGTAGSAREAARALAPRATLPMVLALTARRNPDVLVSWQAWRAVLRQFEQASFLEDTIARFRAFAREIDTVVGPQTHREMTGKTFAFPSVLALRGQLVHIAAQQAELRYESILRKALTDAARGYVQVRYAGRAIAILNESRALFADMEKLTRAQLQVGSVSQADSLKAQSTLASLDTQIATLGIDRTAEVARVDALMGLPVRTAWGEVDSSNLKDAAVPHAELERRALANNQDIRTAVREVEQMDTMIRMAESMLYPRGSAGASLIAPSAGAEAGPSRSAMATFPQAPEVTADRAGFGASAAYIEELRVRAVQARRNRDAVRVRVAQTLQESFARAAVARLNLKTYAGDIAPRAKQAFATMRERYAVARAPFIEFLDAARTYLDAALKTEEFRKDLERALLDLADTTGAGPGELLP
jgi:outer membrane protein TolC